MRARWVVAGVVLMASGAAVADLEIEAAWRSLPPVTSSKFSGQSAPESPVIPDALDALQEAMRKKARDEARSRYPNGSRGPVLQRVAGTVHVWLDLATALQVPDGESGDLLAFEPFDEGPLPRFEPSGPPPRSWLGCPFRYWRAGCYRDLPDAQYHLVTQVPPWWPAGPKELVATGARPRRPGPFC